MVLNKFCVNIRQLRLWPCFTALEFIIGLQLSSGNKLTCSRGFVVRGEANSTLVGARTGTHARHHIALFCCRIGHGVELQWNFSWLFHLILFFWVITRMKTGQNSYHGKIMLRFGVPAPTLVSLRTRSNCSSSIELQLSGHSLQNYYSLSTF